MNISVKYDWYDTTYAIAEAMLPILMRYRENYITKGYSLPTWLKENHTGRYPDGEEEELKQQWLQQVDLIIQGFTSQLAYRQPELYKVNYDEQLIRQAMDTFAKYYMEFWD